MIRTLVSRLAISNTTTTIRRYNTSTVASPTRNGIRSSSSWWITAPRIQSFIDAGNPRNHTTSARIQPHPSLSGLTPLHATLSVNSNNSSNKQPRVVPSPALRLHLRFFSRGASSFLLQQQNNYIDKNDTFANQVPSSSSSSESSAHGEQFHHGSDDDATSYTEYHKEITVETERDMRRLAAKLAEKAIPGDVFCLYGDMGCGKTVFAQGFIRHKIASSSSSSSSSSEGTANSTDYDDYDYDDEGHDEDFSYITSPTYLLDNVYYYSNSNSNSNKSPSPTTATNTTTADQHRYDQSQQPQQQEKEGQLKLHHMDLYRLQEHNDPRLTRQIDVESAFKDICVIEWADRLGDLTPTKQCLRVFFSVDEDTEERILTLATSDADMARRFSLC